MTRPAGSYDPLVTTYPTTPAELLTFAAAMPNEGERRLAVAVAGVMQAAIDAMSAARGARQMILNRDPRFDTLDERYQALITLTDTLQTQQVEIEEAQQRLTDLASSYQAALGESSTDRKALHDADTALGTRVDAVNVRVDATNINTATALSGVDALQKQATTDIANLAAEITRAKGSEQSLSNALGSEVTRAATAENQLASSIGSETTRAKAAESTLTGNLAAEVTRATQAEATLTTNLAGELVTRKAADDALATRTTAVETKNTAQDTAIATVNSNITALQTALAAETTARQNGDAAEATRATAAETALGTRIDKLHLTGTTGSGTIGSLISAGTSTVVITLRSAMPDANYVALPSIDATGSITLGTLTPAVTAKTTTTVTVQVKNSGLSVLSNLVVQVVALSLAS